MLLKPIYSPLLLFILLFFFLATNAQNKKIVLLIGQSNMAGRAHLLAVDSTTVEGVELLNSEGQWMPARNPLNQYSSIRKDIGMQRLGPGWSFAKHLSKKKDFNTLGLVVNAKGGSAINEWMPGTEFYSEAVRRTKQAIEQGGELVGIAWHQGESDVKDMSHYLADLEVLINSLRKEFNNQTLPFVAGQIIGNNPGRAAFNGLILSLPEKVPHTAVVASKGLKVFDGVHFDNKSQKKLGKRYAKAFLKLVKQGN
ncbi:MAG: sialate O-acetylesterase [Cyclobacteriaceae bacterium]|nr:sialate O-acetylesterase [Cyclobacteriaceae bacterium]